VTVVWAARVVVRRAAEHGGTTCPAAGRDTRASLHPASCRQIQQPRPPAQTENKGTPAMSDRLAAHRPPPLKNPSARPRRATIGAAAAIPALLIGALGSAHTPTPHDSGLAACRYPLTTHNAPAAGYPKIRAEFAGSRWPDLRTAGTAYVDLALALHTAHGTDGYQTVWFTQRLSATCAEHGQPLHASS
jgi:hypothetical protein